MSISDRRNSLVRSIVSEKTNTPRSAEQTMLLALDMIFALETFAYLKITKFDINTAATTSAYIAEYIKVVSFIESASPLNEKKTIQATRLLTINTSEYFATEE